MSEIYNITKKFSHKIHNFIRNSFFFTIFLRIYLYLEKEWLNSYFRTWYPKENFLSFFKKSYILKKHIFSPVLVILAFAIFMILASIPISTQLQINIIIGFFCFFVFSMIIPKFVLNNPKKIIKFESHDVYAIGFVLFLIGIIFAFIGIGSAGGIPLLKSSLRYTLNAATTMPIYLLIPGMALINSYFLDKMQKGLLPKSTVKFRVLSISAIAMFLLLLLGYRSPLIAIILIVIIMGYYTNLFEIWEILAGFIIAGLIILGLGYYRTVADYAIANLGPLDFLSIRAGFTLHVLDLLSNISGFTGFMHGYLTGSMIPGPGAGPRILIAQLIDWRSGISITPTLLGPFLVEFGTIGVAIGMSILGFILGAGYKILQITNDSFYIMLYAIILAYSVIGVETGLLDLMVFVFIIVAGIIYFYNIFNTKKS
jgi:oligosaccharide repeat unit polymerase